MLFLKRLIAACLSNRVTGKILRIVFSDKVSIYGASIDTRSYEIKNHVYSEIFFRLYESAEIRFILKYIPVNSTIVELGSSIGVVSSVIAVNKNPEKIFCLEANPKLISIIYNNMERNSKAPYKIENYLITSTIKLKSTLWFNFGNDNTTGQISENEGDTIVPMTSLSNYVSANKIDQYILISDIEGGEYELIFNDVEALNNCKMLIIELHEIQIEGNIVSVEDMKNQILKLGFNILDSYGPNYVFVR